MRAIKGILLAAVVALMSRLREVDTSQSNEVCDNESHVKLSILNGLREQYVLKKARVCDLETRANETKKEVEDAKIMHNNAITAMIKMQELVNQTYVEIDRLRAKIDNMTTSGLRELEELQICSEEDFVTDCCQIKTILPSSCSGIYTIKHPCSADASFSRARLSVYCDMETDGGGWTVIQRRNASMGWVDVVRNWADYENGFGDMDGEFWIGLKNIYELTTQQNMALRLSVWNTSTDQLYWNYPYFAIYGPDDRYALSTSMSAGSGNSRYSPFGYEGQSNYYFTTYDQFSSRNCGFKRQSGWWYYNGDCDFANLNGRHQPSGLCGTDAVGERLVWLVSSVYNIYTNSEMKIRPQSCQLH